MLPRKKIRNLSCCWKCIEIVNPTITTLFCIILNLLRTHQADLFGSRTPLPTGLQIEGFLNFLDIFAILKILRPFCLFETVIVPLTIVIGLSLLFFVQ